MCVLPCNRTLCTYVCVSTCSTLAVSEIVMDAQTYNACILHVLRHVCCTTCTVLYVLCHIYCTVCAVPHILYCMCCATCTVLYVLCYMYCTVCAVLHVLYCMCCATCTVLYVLCYMYCTVCAVLHVLSACIVLHYCMVYTYLLGTVWMLWSPRRFAFNKSLS